MSTPKGRPHVENCPYDVGFIFLVPPKGHPVYTLTNIEKEPYIHSPKTVI